MEHVVKSADPAMKTVAFEDMIAVFGVAVAVTGVALHQATGDGRWEGVASAIHRPALDLCRLRSGSWTTSSLLIGESVEPALVDRIKATIAGHPMVADVVELPTRYLGAHRSW